MAESRKFTESRNFNRYAHKAYHDEQLAGLLSILEQVVDVNMSVEDRVHNYVAIQRKGSPRELLSAVNAWSNEITGYLRQHQPVLKMKRNEKGDRIENPASWTDVLLS